MSFPFDAVVLKDLIAAQYPMELPSLHGPRHWDRVGTIGLRVAELSGADPVVVKLFSLFHDSRRLSEGHDPGHGARGAVLAEEYRDVHFEVSDSQFDLLVEACRFHTDGQTHNDVTIGTCWDADRLDLPRVGIRVNPSYLSTDPARDPEIIAWAAKLSL